MRVRDMVRKTIIVLLSLGAVAIAGVAAISFDTAVSREINIRCTCVLVQVVKAQAEVGIFAAEDRGLVDSLLASFSPAGVEFRNFAVDRTGFRPILPLLARVGRPAGPGFKAYELGPFGLRHLGAGDITAVSLPLWAAFIAFALYPAVAFIRGPYRRRRRGRLGFCRKCGYDLTGLPEPKCPECGQAFDQGQVERDRRRRAKASKRAARWFGKYQASRLRRALVIVSPVGVLLSAVVWGGSYYRVACQVPPLSCRAAWGNIILYYTPSPDGGVDRSRVLESGFSAVGFHGFSTMWWPYPFLRGGRGVALYVPLWLLLLLFAVLWALIYRPVYRLRWREVLTGAAT